MSTRSQILFINGRSKVLVYRHSDGYPSGVIPDLIEFLRWNRGRNSDLEYTIANYFYFFKRATEEYAMKRTKLVKGEYKDVKRKGSPLDIKDKHDLGLQFVQAGHGLCVDNTIHGDIEYFYKVHFIEGEKGMTFKIQAYKIFDADNYSEPSDIPRDLMIWDLDVTKDVKDGVLYGPNLEPKEEMYKKGESTMYATTYNGSAIAYEVYGKDWLNDRSQRRYGLLDLERFGEMKRSEGWELVPEEKQEVLA